MLQMKCPKCDGIISTPLLVEMGSVTCSQCKEKVIVKDVLVVTKDFKMPRDVLMNRVHQYRDLLKEVEKRKSLLGSDDVSSSEDQKSLDQSYSSLRELLEASRGNYRLKVSQDFRLNFEWAGATNKGHLVNLSVKGATIKLYLLQGLPPEGAEVKLRLVLPNISEPLPVSAKIAWIGKHKSVDGQSGITMGVSFVNLDEMTRTFIWKYILEQTRDLS